MKTRKNFTSTFKSKVACEALKENKTVNEIASNHGVHTSQINQWKKTLIENGPSLFERKKNNNKHADADYDEMQRIIGEQAVMLTWYKKKFGNTN